MNKLYKLFGFLALSILALACTPKEPEQAADMIITNANVATLNAEDEMAEAVAVKDGLILAVGSKEEIEKYQGSDSKVIDAKGRTLIPGLNDSHTHVIRAGINYNLELRWDGVTSLKRAMEMLKEQAARTPEGEWIKVVGGFSEFQFEERRLPTLEEINEAVPDKPVMIAFLYTYGMVNKKGLELLGYDKDTYYPGGEVQLDENDNPTGLLIAKPGAAIIYYTLVKTNKLSPEDQYNSSIHYLRQLNRLGMTSAVDAGGGGQFWPDNYQVMKKVAEDKKMTLRVGYYIFAAQKPGEEMDAWNHNVQNVKPGDNYDLFRPNGYFMHGAGENIVWSAGDFENFLQPRPVLARMMEAQLTEALELLLSNNWNFRIHATYGETIKRFLDVFEKLDEKYPFSNIRWTIDHAETVDQETLDRIHALGGGIAIQNRMMFQGEYFIERYGDEMAADAPPIQKMLDTNIPVGLGTDGTRVSSYNPWLSIYWATTGKTWGGTKHLSDENIQSRMDGLRLMTAGSAWFSGEEDKKGTIEPGKYADFAILKSDYFTIPDEEIKDMEAVLTVVNGEVVYGAEEFSSMSPVLPEISPSWSPVKFYGGYGDKPNEQ